jgi:acyl transferase domain-containing protein/NADPH:quinone reductase-like Zn-dependent oxidoreductase/NADP-dependent 3-hydroxy acid dehydrogenase YdfG/SAM-dependent methyltransferase/acyl carrier protein
MTDVAGHGTPVEEQDASVLEPIAIVGIGCRFPGGADSPAAFWELLKSGVDAVTEVPSDRWNIAAFYDPDPKTPGKTCSRWGGFVKGIDRFDAQFFKIAPREAVHMDPQQRMILEVSWEALEDAGLDVDRISGTKAGVFIGASSHDYSDLQSKDVYASEAYTSTGATLSIAANRVSYCLDLHGPSIAVDTACSSSLVAIHLACQSLRSRECGVALSGGVNCLLAPEPTVGFSRATMLSPSGRCRSFDAGADGYVRGEGAAVVVLKRLSDARAARDPIYAVIIGSGVNQDGRSHGLTVPSAEAQEALLRDVYRRAQVTPDRVLYFETHGTGTPVGDPIEAAAIGAALGTRRRRGNPLRIGSLKTNIGHLEAGAGIAGLIKAALVVKHRQIPATLHFSTPNPRIPLENLGLRVQRQLERIRDDEAASAVGVNAFGFGGTNAHVVLDRAPDDAPAPARAGRIGRARPASYLVPLSARSADALKDAASALRAHVGAASPPALADLCYTAGVRRTHHDQRLAVVASSSHDLAERLDLFVAGETDPGLISGRRPSARRPRLAFVFSGMGPQWWAMGRQLLAAEPVFRHAIEECEALFRQIAGWSLLEQLTADAARSRMDEAEIAQPANFALQLGLVALWDSWGVAPDAIVGHSAGEVAAARVAGILNLEDAVRIIYHRSRLQQRATGKGRMLAVGLPPSRVAAAIARFRGRISLAAVNSPQSVTLGGDEDALDQLADALHEMQVFARMLDTRVPYHSHHMEPLQAELLASLAKVTASPAAIPFYSTVSGDRVDGRELSAGYWWANIRQPVQFAPAAVKMLDEGVDAFVELGPHPVLGRAIVEVQQGREHTPVPVLASLRRDVDERQAMLASLAMLFSLGCVVDWLSVNGEGSYIPLPLYPWQRESYWFEPEKSALSRLPASTHPLLQQRLTSANPTWEGRLEGHRLAYLRDHVIQGSVVFPASAYLEAALAASRELTGEQSCALAEVKLRRALVVGDEVAPTIQVVVQPQDNAFTVYSRVQPAAEWTLNATGRLVREAEPTTPSKPSRLRAIQARCPLRLSSKRCYDGLRAAGLQYGPAFQGIEQMWLGRREALARIRRPELGNGGSEGHVFHPAMLDACFQVLAGASFLQRDTSDGADTWLPVEIERLRLSGPVPERGLWCHARLANETQNSLRGDISIFDDDGRAIAEVSGFKCQRVPNARAAASEELTRCLYELKWLARALPVPGHFRRAEYMPAASTLARRLASPEVLERHARKEHYEVVEPQIERLSATYVWEALQRLGFRPRRGSRVDVTKLAAQLSVVGDQHAYLRRLVSMLGDEGILRRAGSHWVVADTAALGESRKLSDAIAAAHPSYAADLVTLDRVGSGLADVLAGARDPQHFLFPDNSVDALFHSYGESPYNLIYNSFIQACVRAVVHALPAGRTLRVLEIGAGTGGTTAHVLSVLPASHTEYVFSDVSALLLAAARPRFRDVPFVDYRRLDINADPGGQGFSAHSFDLIIAADVLHATDDLPTTLKNVASLLSSNGLLIALEITRSWKLFDVMYGGLKDWWRLADSDLHSSQCWLPVEGWARLLSECGFADTAAVSDSGPTWQGIQNVLLARGSCLAPEMLDVQASATKGTWVIFVDDGGVGNELALELEARSDTVVRVSAGDVFARLSDRHFQVRPSSLEDMATLVRAVAGSLRNCRGLVHLWCLDADDLEQPGNDALHNVQERGCVAALHLIQSLTRSEDVLVPPQLWLVTRGAQRVGSETSLSRPSQALLWGFCRVLMSEHPQLRSTLLDLDPDAGSQDCSHLADELYAADAEQEIAWRADARYVARVARSRAALSDGADARRRPSNRDTPFQLEAARPGSLESLRLREVRRSRPRPGEVEIEIRAAGVNFRDVMKAMGLYLDRLGEAYRFGEECAGTVVRVGEDVKGFAIGDEVIAVGTGCFGRFLSVSAAGVVHKPAHWSFEQAATIPIVFLTVHYGLNRLAKLSRGESVLIHSATGGVGLAAIQIAEHAGAEIFATAGSAEKRELLSSLGIKHVMDSRSLAFADEIMASTGGRGVDVVLNSLAGDFLVKSLALLRPAGRFVELGKVDFFENTKLGLAPFSRGLSFHAVDLGVLLQNEPELSKQLFAEVMQMFGAGMLRPLPVRTFPVSDASSAFRLIAQARHVGKLALSMGHQPRTLVRRTEKPSLFHKDATYLVTGGLGGFGLATAEGMVAQGARHLVLVGRSGASSAEAEAGVERLRSAGAVVVAARVDVGRDDEVEALLADVDRTMPPLRGVLHAAMVMDDAFLLQIDAERLRRVIAPKAIGAWNLHRHTLGHKLDFFVLFSSMASLQGTPGQGSYSAANAFLDALAYHRRGRNLPALVVNWGAISDVGYVARNPNVERELRKQGIHGMSSAEALALLWKLWTSATCQVGAIRLDLEQLNLVRSLESSARRYSLVLQQTEQDSERGPGSRQAGLLSLLRASAPDARPHLVESALRADLARVLGVRESQIDPEQPLADLGVDSLMSVEIETMIHASLDIDVPVGFLVSDNVSLRHLSRRLVDQCQAAIDQLAADRGSWTPEPAPHPAVPA